MVSDLVGIRFGKLVVISRHPENTKANKARWVCKCDCGNHCVAIGGSLTSKKHVSCGCHRKYIAIQRVQTHGMSGTFEHRVWKNILARCYRPTSTHYASYGGRGISVCDEWRNSFLAFLADVGHAPSKNHQIDRIDNNGDYNKQNCKWSTRTEQCNNRRNNIIVTYNQQQMTLSQLCRKLNLPYETVRRRIRDYGWSIEKATSK